MILATADSNIYISALQFGGVPLQFLNAARNGTFQLAISGALLNEIRGVLVEKFQWTEVMVDEAIANLLDFTHLTQPISKVSIIADDPDDDRVIDAPWHPALSSSSVETNTCYALCDIKTSAF